MKKIISGIIAGAVLCSTITMNFKFDNNMTINAESKGQLAFTYNGHSYYIYDGVASTWDEAKEFCKNRGGYLAVINDGKENEALFDFVKSSGYNNVYFGYTDKVNEGNWNWVENDNSTYVNWGKDGPDGEDEPNGEDMENYAMFYEDYPSGQWNDGDFGEYSFTVNGGQAFICEWNSEDFAVFPEYEKQNFNNHTYQIIDRGLSWTEAKEYCESIGGHLVTINSQKEQTFLTSIINDNESSEVYSIGLYYDDGDWIWVDDSPVTYTNWNWYECDGERYYMPDSWFDGENYGYMYIQTTEYSDWMAQKGMWNDAQDYINPFICEWESETVSVFPEYKKQKFNNHTYQIIDRSLTWTEAKEYCESIGGHLVTINSQKEQTFLTSIFNEDETMDSYSIGLYYADEEWKWVDDSPVSYTNWNMFENSLGEICYMPDNWEGDEYYGYMFNRTTEFSDWTANKGMWNDSQNLVLPFICEWEEIKEDNNDFNSNNNVDVVNGEFFYPGKSKDYSSEFFYTDEYFAEDAYSEYNEHLSTMSLCLELSIWPSKIYVNENNYDYKNSSINTQNLFDKINFKNFETNDMYKVKPTADSIGVGIANKPVTLNGEDYTLLAVVVRGGGYEKEWASNFKIGNVGDAEGFSEAKDEVKEYIDWYINNYNICGQLKFWVVGYSRGGAVANLTAASLDDGIKFDNCEYSSKDVFAYTFEAPMATVNSNYKDEKYSNIHNVINLNDIVPKVAPSDWNFHRYGQDHILPSNVSLLSINVARMFEKYESLESTSEFKKILADGTIDDDTYKLDNFSRVKLKVCPTIISQSLSGVTLDTPLIELEKSFNSENQDVFLRNFLHKFVNCYVKNRNNYNNRYQDDIRYLLSIFMGLSSEQKEKVIENFGGIEELISCLSPILTSGTLKYLFDPQAIETEVYTNIAEKIGCSLKRNGIPYDQSRLNEAFVNVLDLVMATGSNGIEDAIILIGNISSIGNAHTPELCLAWLQSQDDNYTPFAQPYFISGAYRELSVNCPVDVKIINQNQEVVASIIDDSCQGGLISCGINNQGEKVFYIPAEEEYNYEIIAREDCEVSIAIREFSQITGNFTRFLNFEKCNVKKDEMIVGETPMYSSEDIENIESSSSVVYSACYVNGENIAVKFDEENTIANEYCNVSFDECDNLLGVLKGSGAYLYGSYAQVEVVPYEGCVFEGWYIDNEIVSKDSIYRFQIVDDISLQAKFSSEKRYVNVVTKSIDNTDCGEVEGIQSGEFNIGSIISVNAIPSIGYEFVQWESDNVIIEDIQATNTRIMVPSDDSELIAIFKKITNECIGDVNGDGSVDSSDASLVLAEYAKVQTGGVGEFTEIQHKAADVNNDGVVDSSDASKILAYYAMVSTGKKPTWD